MKRNEEPASLEKLKASALRMLARRDHSLQELKTKLRQRYNFEPGYFEDLVSYLKSYGYLVAERDLSQRWAQSWRAEGRGRFWIEGKLKIKGLPTAGLTDDDKEIETARAFLEKKLRNQKTSKLSFPEKVKVARKLAARGFSQSVISKILHDRP